MKRILLTLSLCVASVAALAEKPIDGLTDLQHRWAEIQYKMPEAEREKAFEALAEQADALVEQYPGRAEPLIWHGIVLSTYAGAKGGLGALKLVKVARNDFERALSIDASALQGSAYTSLGSLYYQVPGWPLGFGDDEKAEAYLKEALAINPDGIDPNYFYGDFLMDQGRHGEARRYFQKAFQAESRPDRPLADEGRRAEIKEKLSELPTSE
ncbi:tetratricopeptide repeat protein [Marinimicrobium sp. C6131]|jgi:tetratricopeptide (TPR) repeat protein|uniref:tetratricopeptide repeat protein n=1 Tax=Marinimicrobium TaxID=359337 RepID=UPI00223CF814|nr:tetratricopeptide repeat protein [Marinimicrobium sp. C6131]UZJ43413.1 hypothetical protein OOT55_12195 [Marinimicrobium sp. C6131]